MDRAFRGFPTSLRIVQSAWPESQVFLPFVFDGEWHSGSGCSASQKTLSPPYSSLTQLEGRSARAPYWVNHKLNSSDRFSWHDPLLPGRLVSSGPAGSDP